MKGQINLHMRMILLVIMAFIYQNLKPNLFAQNLPIQKIRHHLILSGELDSSEVNHGSYTDYMVIVSMFKRGESQIFSFSANSPHSYTYLLLKNKNRYKILNCQDIIEDWPDIDTIFKITHIGCVHYDVIEKIIGMYLYNNKYHKTPPYPILFPKNDSSIKLKYPLRKVIKTKPFIFR